MIKLYCPELLLSLFLLASCGNNGALSSTTEFPKMYTTAFAERRVEPNMAKLVFAVMTRAATAEKAREENAVKTSSLVAKLKEMKVSDEDLQTLDFRLQEVMSYHNGVSKIDSYEVLSRMQLRVLDVKNVGKMIDQLVPLGANKIENIEFDVAEKEEIYRELLEEATALAREKASRMAEAAGLGKVTVIEVREEMGFNNPAPMFKMAAMADARGAEESSTQLIPSTVLKASISLTAKAKE